MPTDVCGTPGRPARAAPPLVQPALGLFVLTVAAWMAIAVWPHLILIFGLEVKGSWFLDSYAILATLDARRIGLDPLAPNPLDLLHRPHVYSDWWYALGSLGLGRKDNFVVGSCWVAAFLASALAVLRPRRWGETAGAILLLASPPVLLAIYRANNDVVIFTLLALAGLAIGTDRNGWLVFAGTMIALATGLKFYPAVAAGFVVLLRPVPRLIRAAGLLAAALGLVIWDVWSQAQRGVFDMPQDVHKLGALILLRDLGFEQLPGRAAGAVVIFAGGWWLAARRYTCGLGGPGVALRARACFLIGALVVLACFLAGISFAYRWVFLLLLLPWLWDAGAAGGTDAGPRWVLRLTFALMVFVVWSDGLLCAAFNLDLVPQQFLDFRAALESWRLVTQPLHWLLAMLLAGWCWDAVLAAGREWRRPGSSAPHEP